MSHGPARRYSWAPFQKDNTVSLRHGGWSPRTYSPLAEVLVDAVLEDANWLRPVDMPCLWAWAREEARAQLVSEWLIEHGGDLDDEGKVRPAAELLTRLEARAESLRGRLGLDPLSRARLGRDVAAQSVDLARLWASESAAEQQMADDPGQSWRDAVALMERPQGGHDGDAA